MDHPNIIRSYEVYQDSNNYYLITEFSEGYKLFEMLGN